LSFGLPHNSPTAPAAQRYYGPAALAAGVAAWRLGNDVQQAVRDAGYGVEVAQGIYDYIHSRFFDPDEPATQPTESQEEEMSTRVKRARTGVTTVARSKPKVSREVRTYVRKCMKKVLEKKYRTQNHSAAVPGTGGAFYDIGVRQIVQGTGEDNRTGSSIKLLRVAWNGLFYDPTTVTGSMRMILFVDTQSNGANPAVNQILNEVATYGNYNSDYVIGAGGARFRILADRFVKTDWEIAATPNWHHVKGSCKLDVDVTYTGTGGTVADIAKNNVLCLVLGFTTTGTIALNFKTTFVDS